MPIVVDNINNASVKDKGKMILVSQGYRGKSQKGWEEKAKGSLEVLEHKDCPGICDISHYFLWLVISIFLKNTLF